MKEISTVDELNECLSTSTDGPAFIFKHSTRCPISAGAFGRVRDFLDRATESDPPIYLLKVVESRAASNAATEQLAVPHQSPQIILVKGGEAVWSTSHHNITAENIQKAIRSVTDGAD